MVMTAANPEAMDLERIARAVWMPPERLTVDEWADRHRVLIAEASAEPGRWSTARTPYLRQIMRAWTDPRVREIILKCGSQLGKTECVFNCVLYTIDMDPGPMLFVYPNDKLATSTNKDRLVPTIQATAAAARHLTASPQDIKSLQLTLDAMNLWFTGANNATNLKGRPCRFVPQDEIDEFPPGAAAKADERVKAFPDSKIIKTSTPSDAGVGIDAEYARSDQRRYEVPCPECGVYQELVFDSLTWDGGSEASPDQVERTTRYVCPHCACEIYEHRKAGMMTAGVWIPKGQSVEVVRDDGEVLTQGAVPAPRTPPAEGEDGEGSGGGSRGAACHPDRGPHGARSVRLVGQAERPDSSVIGFHLSSLYSPFPSCSWGSITRKYAEAGFARTREFVNGYLGEAWALDADKAEARELDHLMVPVAAGGFEAGTAPAGVLALVGSIDIQADAAWWAIYGFGAGGRDVWLIDFGQVLAGRGGDLRELDGLLGREVQGPAGPMRPRVWALDTGHRAEECYRLCRRARGAGFAVVPTKGQEKMRTPHAVGRIDKFPDGRPMPGGLLLLHVNTDHWKESVVGMIKRQKDRSAAAAAGRFAMPAGDGHEGADGPILREFARQVTAEHKVVVPDRNSSKRGLRPTLKSEWRLKPGVRDNHALDTLVGALAVADAMNVRQMGEEKREQRTESREPQEVRERRSGASDPGRRERFERLRERMRARRGMR